MKKSVFLIQIVLFFGCMVMYTSCGEDFLSKEPPATLLPANMADMRAVEGTLTGAYHMVRGGGIFGQSMGTNWVWGSAAADDAYKGSDAGDQTNFNLVERFEVMPDNPYVNDRWRTCYEGIHRSNNTLKFLEANLADADVKITASRAQEIRGEARFLRAFFHFSAQLVFENIPYITEDVDAREVRNTPGTGWAGIEADLNWVISNNALPPSWNAANQGRPTMWSAKALLGKVYMHQNKLAQAAPLFDEIINSGVFSLRPNYYDNYDERTENNSESIFEIQAAVQGGNHTSMRLVTAVLPQYGPAGFGWGFYQPSQNLVDAFMTSNDGLPYLFPSEDPRPGEPTQFRRMPNDMNVAYDDASWTPYTGPVDPRLDYTVARRGIPFLDYGMFGGEVHIREQLNGGPYMTKKFVHFRATAGQQVSNGSSNNRNFRYLRLSHILLWRAEIHIENNELAQGMALINQIRNRSKNGPVVRGVVSATTFAEGGFRDASGADLIAGATTLAEFVTALGNAPNNAPSANYVIEPYPAGHAAFSDQKVAREAYKREMRLEFATEGHRYFDLRRWGMRGDESLIGDGRPYDVSVLNNYVADEATFRSFMAGSVYNEGKRFWPIPQSQLDLTGGDGGLYDQNPNWK